MGQAIESVFVTAEGGIVNAAAILRWRFPAVKAGEIDLQREYHRLQETDAPPVNTFGLGVTVQSLVLHPLSQAD